ncbi:hypothetical protein DCAR_0414453 [Daucus carota subsp. sativus]|uniref:Uncharacterized protein n=1 Tax=Daucus carota subsp. sativus TaxID=79200 RepID=A0A175YBQ9_DAUCS|nr:hypothetical protein DCAR_0414453 [Daucus carota subsp. sativus]
MSDIVTVLLRIVRLFRFSVRTSIPEDLVKSLLAPTPIEISRDLEATHHSSSQGHESNPDESFQQGNLITTAHFPTPGFEASSSSRPRIVRRSVSVVRDFPPGCGPFATKPPVPPPMPPPVPSPTYPSGIRSPIPYHLHQAVDRALTREHSPVLAAQLDQIPIGPYLGIPTPSPDIHARVRALTQAYIARARHVEPYASPAARAVHYQHLVDWLVFELGVIGGHD